MPDLIKQNKIPGAVGGAAASEHVAPDPVSRPVSNPVSITPIVKPRTNTTPSAAGIIGPIDKSTINVAAKNRYTQQIARAPELAQILKQFEETGVIAQSPSFTPIEINSYISEFNYIRHGTPGTLPVIDGVNFNLYGQDFLDEMRKQYVNKFASGYDYSFTSEDNMRMQQGLMPKAWQDKYTNSKLDQWLFGQGLPSAQYWGTYADDAWKAITKTRNEAAEKAVQTQLESDFTNDVMSKWVSLGALNGKASDADMQAVVEALMADEKYVGKIKIKTLANPENDLHDLEYFLSKNKYYDEVDPAKQKEIYAKSEQDASDSKLAYEKKKKEIAQAGADDEFDYASLLDRFNNNKRLVDDYRNSLQSASDRQLEKAKQYTNWSIYDYEKSNIAALSKPERKDEASTIASKMYSDIWNERYNAEDAEKDKAYNAKLQTEIIKEASTRLKVLGFTDAEIGNALAANKGTNILTTPPQEAPDARAIEYAAQQKKKYNMLVDGLKQHIDSTVVHNDVGETTDKINPFAPAMFNVAVAEKDLKNTVEGQTTEQAIAEFREEYSAKGYSAFDLDEAVRIAGYEKYLDDDVAAYNYISNSLATGGYPPEAIELTLRDLTDEDISTAKRDMLFNNTVHTDKATGTLRSIVSIPVRAALALAGSAVGVADFVIGANQSIISGEEKEAWKATQWFAEQSDRWRQFGTDEYQPGATLVSDVGSELLRLYAVSWLGNMASSAAGSALGVTASTTGLKALLVSAAKSAPFVAGAVGSYFNEAMAQGADRREATLYALVSGTVEGLTEKMATSEILGRSLTKPMAASIAKSATKESVKRILLKGGVSLANTLVAALGEGIEEGVSYIASGLMRQATFDKNYRLTAKDLGQDMLMGALVGGLMSGLSAPKSTQQYQIALDIANGSPNYSGAIDSLFAAIHTEAGLTDGKLREIIEQHGQQTEGTGEAVMSRDQFADEMLATHTTRIKIDEANAEFDKLNERRDAELAEKKAAYESALARVNAVDPFSGAEAMNRYTSLNKKLEEVARIYKTAQADYASNKEKAAKDYASVIERLSEQLHSSETALNSFFEQRYAEDLSATIRRQEALNAPDGLVSYDEHTKNNLTSAKDIVPAAPTTDTDKSIGELEYLHAGLGLTPEDITAWKRVGRGFYQRFVNNQAGLSRLAKVQRKITTGTADLDAMVQLVRNAGGTAEAILGTALFDSQENRIGESFQDIVRQIPQGQQAAFQEYLLHKHNTSRMSLEERGYGENKAILASDILDPDGERTPITAAESEAKVAEIEAAHPEFIQAANNLYQWWDKFMRKWAVETGLIPEQVYNILRDKYPYYVPTYRVGKDASRASSYVGRNAFQVAGVLKSATGSLSDVASIFDSFADQVQKIVRTERKNELITNLYNFTLNNPTAARGYAAISEYAGEAADGDYSALDALEIESVKQVEDGVYRAVASIDGERVSLNISKDVYTALNTLRAPGNTDSVADNQREEIFRKIRKATAPIRAGITTYNPLFGITNSVRDLQTSFVNTDAGMLEYFGNIGRAVSERAKNSEKWQTFIALGGHRSGFVGSQRAFTSVALSEGNTASKLVKGAGDVLSAPAEYTETLFRFAEYLHGVKKYGDTPDGRRQAALGAADVTVNFSRSGTVTKMADSFTLYLNANVQGLDKMARQMKNHPVKTALNTLPLAGLAAVLRYLLGNDENPHYENLPNYVKDANFLIPNILGERDEYGYCTTFIKLPKSREYGVLIAALFERSARYADGEDADSAFEGWDETVITGFLPPSPLTENVFSPAVDALRNNKNYFGSDIVPAYMQNEPTLEQKTAQTSTIAIAISEALHGMGKDISPMIVEYLIEQYGGFLGQATMAMTTGDAGDIGTSASNIIRSKFVADPLYSSGVVSRFYDALNEAKTAAQTAKEEREKLGIDRKSKNELIYTVMNNAQKEITDLRKQERAIIEAEPDSKDRKKKIDAIRKQINEVASKGLNPELP